MAYGGNFYQTAECSSRMQNSLNEMKSLRNPDFVDLPISSNVLTMVTSLMDNRNVNRPRLGKVNLPDKFDIIFVFIITKLLPCIKKN